VDVASVIPLAREFVPKDAAAALDQAAELAPDNVDFCITGAGTPPRFQK